MKFSFALSSLLVGSALGSSNAESNQHLLRSVTASSVTSEQEDITSIHHATIPDIPRVLKKAKGTAKEPKAPKSTKKPKVPKGAAAPGKEPKSAKGSGTAVTASPSAQTTSQTTSQPSLSSPPTVDPCADISSQKEALLALKAGFNNGDAIYSDWDSTTDPCDNLWTGITCNGSGEVITIDLRKFNMFW